MALWDTIPYSLRQLQYLVAVADLGGFRKAADACGVAQPSMSAQIAQVEQALGVQIFERGPRGVRVTARRRADRSIGRGRRSWPRAIWRHRAAAQRSAAAARVRIGVIPTVCPYLLPEVAPSLRRRCPNLHVIWSEDKTQALVDQIERAALDGAIVALDDRMAQLRSRGDRRRSVRARGRAWASAGEASWPGVARRARRRDRVPARGRSLLSRSGAGAFAARRARKKRDLKATGLSTLVQMVGGGDGVTLLPRLAVPVENRRGQLTVRAFRVTGADADAGAGLAQGVRDEAAPCRSRRGDQEGLAEVDFR